MARFLALLLLFPAFFSVAADLPVLTKACRGPEVSMLQKILRRNGYAVEPHGLFDENTENAVRFFNSVLVSVRMDWLMTVPGLNYSI